MATGCRTGGRFWRGETTQAIVKDADDIQRTQLGIWLDFRHALRTVTDGPNREVRRKRVRFGTRDNSLSLLRDGAFRPIQEAWPWAIRTGQDRMCAAALEDH